MGGDLGWLLEWAASKLDARIAGTEPAGIRDGALRLTLSDGRYALLKYGDTGARAEFETEAAGLQLAQRVGLPVPQLIAADLSGMPVLLMAVAAGSNRIPVVASARRLQAVGAAAAGIHRVTLAPSDALPLRERHMPWVDFAALRRSGEEPSTPLLEEADSRLSELPRPETSTVFVHGDLWQGNLMFEEDVVTAIIDWEAAGAGQPGVDIGSLRWDAAILFGPNAPDEVLRGWEAASGGRAEHVAYWDVVAALNTPANWRGDSLLNV